MAPIDVLMAATASGADLIGSDEIGKIEPGRYADIVATPGNSFDDMAAVERIDFVMNGGVVYKRSGVEQAVKLLNP